MLLTPFILGDALAGASKPHALLVDFGLAEIFDETAAVGGPATVKGSPAYLSPEGGTNRGRTFICVKMFGAPLSRVSTRLVFVVSCETLGGKGS